MLWPDPTDHSKLKPQYLKGTPANKFCTLLGIGFATVVLGGYNLIWYIPYFERKLERYALNMQKSDEAREAKELMLQPMVQDAISRKVHENERDPEPWIWLK